VRGVAADTIVLAGADATRAARAIPDDAADVGVCMPAAVAT
jgi:hypothetical protein